MANHEDTAPPSVPRRTVDVAHRFPSMPAFPRRTTNGTPYFVEAGVAMTAATLFDPGGAKAFLGGWDESLGFGDYLDDLPGPTEEHFGDDGGLLAKAAGQLCYLSLGANRTRNADAGRYVENVLKQKHGSVLEHASFTFLIWGVDRALTHELVRHRVGFSYSQASQRYCDAGTLRFVMRPEIQVERLPADADDDLRKRLDMERRYFVSDIDEARSSHGRRVERLAKAAEAGHPSLWADTATARRKRVNQVARRALPNETEAPIVVTGNGRSWRAFIDKRAGAAADAPIRELAVKVLRCLQVRSPLLFGDYEVKTEADGTDSATSPHFAV